MIKRCTNLTKNIYRFFFAASLIACCFSSYATNHRVGCEDYVFVPDSFNAVVGDTVTWYWINGEHEPKSLTIPIGAASWEQIVDAADTTLAYVITVPGTYNYECLFHYTDGMIGKFIVTSYPAGISNVAEDRPLKVYPIPFQQNLTIDLNNNSMFKNGATIEISNIIGQQKFYMNMNESLSAPLTLDLSDLEPGIYFLTVSEGLAKKTIRLMKSE